ncbi:hypothetical protein ACPOL_1000 [Acidisarcina polymorpha]|uniref:Uncharacterized protein n=2 Tax=Acidisarcina polymorpha TaxID=2211140 RepID=A0A2Z5FU33_9BACT|nr:hypothetical protein ACPOL_1000 [Acidisarcina polymorpha]
MTIALCLVGIGPSPAQQITEKPTLPPVAMQQQIEKLAEAVTLEEAEVKSSQQQIQALREQVAALQEQLAASRASPTAPSSQAGDNPVGRLSAAVDALHEQQDLQQSEIATHEQTKVESASKFPVKLTGLILMNAFTNSTGVDVIQSPTLATGGAGTTGITLRQTILGLDARGPHLFGANTSADVRVDFFGGLGQANYAAEGGTARLRTAHVDLAWKQTRAFVEMDRPIISPNTPSSLTAVAQPALAWSGNLWNWVPQIGVEQSVKLDPSSSMKVEAAVADVPDPPTIGVSTSAPPAASLAEQSRWPGSEARIGYSRENGLEVGAAGYFSPHSAGKDFRFDAWAATIDYRVPLIAHLEASGSLYRGLGLGGLGGGAFKDYVYSQPGNNYSYRPLDDVGGWTQLKARATERIEFNTAFGIDNAFSSELKQYTAGGSANYQNMARNATLFTNVIFSPTAYTLFSFEYRRIDTSAASGSHLLANIYGVAAGYRF